MNLEKLRRIFTEFGVVRIFAKHLSPNDNSKNQIYLAGSFDVLHALPHGDILEASVGKGGILKAQLRFYWLDGAGKPWAAPSAQLILYPQYPEVRLSGVLNRACWAPSEIIASREEGRVLVLGVVPDGRILAVAAVHGSELQRSLQNEEPTGVLGALNELHSEGAGSSRASLLRALRRVTENGWIQSKRLDSNGNVLSCIAPNCGGLTLEAELGIRPNAIAGPDFLGWEIKQHGVRSLMKPSTGILTLMTPEPDGGDYKQQGLEYFIRTYGYGDRRGRADRLNFGGIFKVGRTAERTGLTLQVQGYDAASGKMSPSGGSVVLLTASGSVAASWSFATLLTLWTRKHAQAAFIPSECRPGPPRAYRYGSLIHLGVGTDFVRFLASLQAGYVYYDPGIKLEQAGGRSSTKRRSQFRISFPNLARLYASFTAVDLSVGSIPPLFRSGD